VQSFVTLCPWFINACALLRSTQPEELPIHSQQRAARLLETSGLKLIDKSGI